MLRGNKGDGEQADDDAEKAARQILHFLQCMT